MPRCSATEDENVPTCTRGDFREVRPADLPQPLLMRLRQGGELFSKEEVQ